MSWKRRIIFAAVLVAVIWKFRLRWKMTSRKDRVGKVGVPLEAEEIPLHSTTVCLLATVPYLGTL